MSITAEDAELDMLRAVYLSWDAKFSPGTPDAAIIGVIEAAEWKLAERRGGPVTDAQAAKAR